MNSQFGILIPTPQKHLCFFRCFTPFSFNALHGFLFGAFLHKASAIIHPFHAETGLLDQNITKAYDSPWVKGRHGFRKWRSHHTKSHIKKIGTLKIIYVYLSELSLNLGVLKICWISNTSYCWSLDVCTSNVILHPNPLRHDVERRPRVAIRDPTQVAVPKEVHRLGSRRKGWATCMARGVWVLQNIAHVLGGVRILS